MLLILTAIVTVPILAFFTSLLIPNEQEKKIAYIASGSTAVQGILILVTSILWITSGMQSFDEHLFTVYAYGKFDFGIDLYFDKLTAVYGLLSSFILLIICRFSRFYMHRENGYKRYFLFLLLFQCGLSILVFSGNFETLFFGWEIIGITSFLLIGFYRERYLPVRNALKVLSFYRLGDVALLCGIWFFHHLSHESFVFSEMKKELSEIYTHPNLVYSMPVVLALLIILAATIKSGQIPFCSWLPRAMEGPTVSSALFYSALSVHLGVFLLLRTSPLWSAIPEARYLLIIIGVLTAILSNWTAAVQSTVKSKIAYATITQIGIMFACMGMGWFTLVLIHLTGHALMRTYQMLISPSSMHYFTHLQIHKTPKSQNSIWNKLPLGLRDTIYTMSVKEWGLDGLWYYGVWSPLKRFAGLFQFMRKPFWIILLLVLLVFSATLLFLETTTQTFFDHVFYRSIGIIGLILVLVSWTERESAGRAWFFVFISQLFFMISVLRGYHFVTLQILFYLSGILIAGIMGWISLRKLENLENGTSLNEFHGHVYEHPMLATVFMVAGLTMIGFPFTPTFLGFDILFSKIGLQHPVLIFTGFMTFIFLELSVLRIYARIFLGQHIKTYHEVAFRNS